MISGEINIKPLSVNEAYTGRRYKTEACRVYCKNVGWLLKSGTIQLGKLEINITWYFSDPSSDIDNPAKIFIDTLQKKYRFNDKEVYKLTLEKKIVSKGQEKIKYEIKEYRD